MNLISLGYLNLPSGIKLRLSHVDPSTRFQKQHRAGPDQLYLD
jgi:hypothetical protein